MKKKNDEPIPYVVVEPLGWPCDAPSASSVFGANDPPAAALLGTTPDTVPPKENGGLELSVYGKGGSKPLRELRIGEAQCPRCRSLLAELLEAVTDFTALSRPVIQRYAALSYNEVRDFERALKSPAERVKTLRRKYENHQRDAGHR